MRQDDFIGQKFHWFTGEIKDINDEDKKFNRVKVKCHGYHPDEITSSKLPWATVMMPVTSAGTPNVGANHHLEVGSWVFGFFRDGPSAQDPVVIGSITTSTSGTADLHSSASTTNKIYRSQAGHLIEIENGTLTPAVKAVEAVVGVEASEGVEAVEEVVGVEAVAESQSGDYLRVTHRGGTKIEIDDDNNLTITVKEGGDLGITVEKGDTTIITGGDTNIKSTGDTTITSTGKSSIVSGKEVTITSAVSTTIV
jgi:hypothetical protein